MFGCGKKVEDNSTQKDVKRPGLSTQLIKLQAKLFKNGQTIDQEHVFETDSEVAIPDVIKVESGSAANQTARLYFNVDENDQFSFYCNYTGDVESGTMYYFDTCYIEEGNFRPISYYPGNEPIVYSGHSVLFQIYGSNPQVDTEALSELEVDTH